MSLKDTKELEEARAKLDEAKAELERMSALNLDQQLMITSMRTEIEKLCKENERLNEENAMLDAENGSLVKSLEQICLENLKLKRTPKVVVAVPSMINTSSASTAAVTSSGRPVKGVVKMSYAEANPDIMRELRWDHFWEIVERWLLPVFFVAIVIYGLGRYWL